MEGTPEYAIARPSSLTNCGVWHKTAALHPNQIQEFIMKKTLALVSLLVLALACAAPPTNDVATTNRNANLAPSPSPAMTEADAIAKEKAIWEAIKVRDFDAFSNMLADDQVEVLDVGVFDKAASIAGVKDFEPIEVVFSDWKYLPIDKDAFVLVYTANVKAKYKGKEGPPQVARCSSAWANRAGKWVAVFHQECPLKPPMTPAPTPAASPKPTASPATAPVATTGPDPIANEKLVWDLFKSKNYDVFETLLVPEFMEVEPQNVYDKAESVQGVSTFNASKAVLSDFKTVNIDADAAIVIYSVANPGVFPGPERHSTVWVNRNGKWMGLFHHGGTPVVKAPATPQASASPTVR
jgi:hypothetical protein